MQAVLDLRREPTAAAVDLEGWRERLVRYAARALGDPAEAEDVAQETIVRAGVEGRALDARSVPAWLHAVCWRLAIDRRRARGREARAVAGLGADPRARAGVAGESEAERREEGARVRAAVEALPEPYGSAVALRYFEGLDFPAVAARLGTIERTARTWVGRGLAKLREKLGAEAGTEP